MRKARLALLLLMVLTVAAGCRLNLRRLNKRLDRWEALEKKGTPDQKVQFAVKSLRFFLETPDIQRGRESLLSEPERLRYHSRMGSMQVFLIDYHASRALEALETDNDWERAALEWARADSLARGMIPGHSTIYKMVLLQRGYDYYLKEISGHGFRYKRMERQFPGLMEAFRKMSAYRFKLADHLEKQGRLDDALEHYLMVLKRDPENYHEANRRVIELTGRVIREVLDVRYHKEMIMKNFNAMKNEVFGSVETQLAQARQEFGDSAELYLPAILASLAERQEESIERTTDLYLYIKNEMEGTLNEYLDLWRPQLLKGQKPMQPLFFE
ncbi:MAG: hypothetical protein U9P14_12240 [Gemmatimonadota bacterium]|nr:hypothetical protein [Gemmatimonadota bacterium]